MGNPREAGILLPIFSLPSRHGIGDLGPGSRAFIEFLDAAGQRGWQFLPIHPVRSGAGYSPYDSPSAFAGSVLLISPEDLMEEGWLSSGDLTPIPDFPSERIDYPAVIRYKRRLLDRAFRNFRLRGRPREFSRFHARHAFWLEDFALFTAFGRRWGTDWREWPPPLRLRHRVELERVGREVELELEKVRFEQFLFFRQWRRLREESARRRIRLIGDLPFYVTLESADVWSAPRNFLLNDEGDPLSAAGVPPDYFSRTGQLWGNPVYRWPRLRRDGYAWWQRRIAHEMELVDRVRLDHFRGFVASWRTPAGSRTAASGHWARGPGRALLRRLVDRFGAKAFIAEDLGTITPPVHRLRREMGLPGMTVLLFAFGSDDPRHPYLPVNHERNSVAYTGTHDNPPARAWFEKEAGPEERERVFRCLGRRVTAGEIGEELARLVLGSRSDSAVIPLQDYLGLGESARINFPAGRSGNWRWRLGEGALNPARAGRIAALTRAAGR